jgi:hypothetical protein
MDFDTLSIVKFGDVESLNEFLFENGLQHRLFRDTFFDQGIQDPAFPLIDADPNNLDDWLLAHQVEHQSFANLLGLDNPFDMLDTDWNDESDFYDWLSSHLSIHQAIAASLGLT